LFGGFGLVQARLHAGKFGVEAPLCPGDGGIGSFIGG
jgi:hypothetical protein